MQHSTGYIVGFAVAILPEPGEVEGAPSPLRALLLGLDDGFPVWDLLPEFQQSGGRVLLIPGDGHPNAQGQRVLAELLRPRLDALASSASRAPGLGSR